MSAPMEPPREVIRWPQPGKLWSLWEMYELDARAFVAAIATLTEVKATIRKFEQSYADDAKTPISEKTATVITGYLEALSPQLVALQAEFALTHLNRTCDRLDDVADQFSYTELATAIDEIGSRLGDELEQRLVVVIDTQLSAHYQAEEPLFGREAFDAFPEAAADIEEAGKCLALGRGTACVFHLMRAMEVAVRILAPEIGVATTDANGDNIRWGVIVSKMKDAIPKLAKDQQGTWTEVHNLAWGVNKATRNPVMHPGIFYTDEQAKRAFDATRNFMQHLAPLVP